MAFPFDPVNARVRVSTTVGGTYASVGKVVTANSNETQEGRTKTKYLGGQVVRPGDNNWGGDIAVLYDSADTTGQEILKTAKRNGTSVFLQFCPEGSGTGAKVEQGEVNITALSLPFDASAEILQRSFSFEGVDDAPTTVTLA
jgi:hypothetical protein